MILFLLINRCEFHQKPRQNGYNYRAL
jgi:hypothetical protein